MKLNEAIEAVRIYTNSEYVCSGKIYDVTYKYHAGNRQMFIKLCKEIATKGCHVVDDCVEELYQIVFNVNNEGDVLDADDKIALVERVKEIINKEVTNSTGYLMKAGVTFGIVS
jgi:hypothetical protein